MDTATTYSTRTSSPVSISAKLASSVQSLQKHCKLQYPPPKIRKAAHRSTSRAAPESTEKGQEIQPAQAGQGI
ncbi:hypothetical protein BDV29DRAFT_176837 [Aspergillus leporis]|uniref:Uncharacterized protein n=1 Tax=Aspergillus leporis TaxID=41062 RepID=A0A5N5WY49_9EURO|nr:hypothetical protein BDV29DRAFT_176837 [Aspergillus leporis]